MFSFGKAINNSTNYFAKQANMPEKNGKINDKSSRNVD